MKATFSYKSFSITASPLEAERNLASILEAGGLKKAGSAGGALLFRNPWPLFSMRRPLTCISRVSIAATTQNGFGAVRIGVDLFRIKGFISALVLGFCFTLPLLAEYWLKNDFQLPPTSWVGIPAGFLFYWHVRACVFRHLGKLVSRSGV
jgi:hypothetical protein